MTSVKILLIFLPNFEMTQRRNVEGWLWKLGQCVSVPLMWCCPTIYMIFGSQWVCVCNGFWLMALAGLTSHAAGGYNTWIYHLFPADFGVSAKNTKTLQRRDSFIGTPYWWGIYLLGFCLSCKKYHYESGNSLLPRPFSIISFQDGSRGGDVRDIEGPSVRFQGWHLVPRDHLNWTRTSRASKPWDEPNESFAENSKIRSSNFDAAVSLVSPVEKDVLSQLL